jgi:hypothetical protein
MVRRCRALVGVVALGLGGCGERGLDGDGAGDSGPPVCGEGSSSSDLPIVAVDILVVVDGNEGSQAAQARLVAGLDSLVTTLESATHPIDYRIAVTTTAMGSPACDPSLTTPERGELAASSCRARLDEFVDGQGQDHAASCTDRCSYENLDFLAHRWVERDGEQLELPAGVDPAEVVRCLAMRGVTGCAFESPLAAIEAAMLGSATPGHPNEGFFRAEARRVFVVVSDAFDCSWTDAGLAIFDPEGERTFWSDPLAEAATPAACWNAGTDCDSFDGVTRCEVGYYDASGTPTGDPTKYMLRRPDDFAEAMLFSAGWGDELLFWIGVPVEGVDALAFPLAGDPADMLEHGIGPGCEGPEGTSALPPVRVLRFLRAIDHGLGDPNDYAKSICAPDFTPEFDQLGVRLVEALTYQPCFAGAVCDVDPATPRFDVDCQFYGYPPVGGGERVQIEECAHTDDGAYLVDLVTGRPAMPGPGVELCYLIQTDVEGLTEDPFDDYNAACEAEFGGTPASFDVVTFDGRSPKLSVRAECSTIPSAD